MTVKIRELEVNKESSGSKDSRRPYKPSKTLEQQIEYLKNDKKVVFNEILEDDAKKILLRYNYINVISPFKYHFAWRDNKGKVIKNDGKHIYKGEIEFAAYYHYYRKERDLYPIIFENIIAFETQFKAIMEYHILTNSWIENPNDLTHFLEAIKDRFSNIEGNNQ